MIYKATELIANEFAKHDLKYHTIEGESSSRVSIAHSPKIGAPFALYFISHDDSMAYAMRLWQVFAVDPDDPAQIELAAAAVAEANARYKYLKFILDEKDGDIDLEWDAPQCTTEELVGPMALETYLRTVKVLADFQPRLLRKLYSGAPSDTDD